MTRTRQLKIACLTLGAIDLILALTVVYLLLFVVPSLHNTMEELCEQSTSHYFSPKYHD